MKCHEAADCFPCAAIVGGCFDQLLTEIKELKTWQEYDKWATTEAENKSLKKFARYVIKQECWGLFELDGGDIQDLAERLGLIEPHIVVEEDVDDESNYEVGDTIFRFSEVLKGE